MADTKPCTYCEGSGSCPKCHGDGYTDCSCFECEDWHEAECEECLGEGDCIGCNGGGTVKLTDADREAAGQLTALEAP